MRILHVVPSYLPATRYGGPIYSVHALCAALVRMGHDVHVFTTNVDGPGVSAVPSGVPLDLDGVKVTYFETGLGRRLYRSPAMMHALACIPEFDVVHLHSVYLWPTSAAAAASRRAGIPYLLSPRGMLVSDLIRRKSRLLKVAWLTLFEKRNIAAAAAVHVTSEIEADEMIRLGFVPRRVVLVPNGVDVPPQAIAIPGVRGSNPHTRRGHVTVLCLGRINWKKGLDRLIAVAALIPEMILQIAGNDEEDYQPKLQELARQLNVADRVDFLGPVYGDAKWNLIASADVFALASHSENFGNAVLEAMACGVPVVVTPGVGLAKTVASVSAGVVTSNEPNALATAIASLLADPGERRRLGDNGRRAVSEGFSWDGIAKKMDAAYVEAIADKAV